MTKKPQSHSNYIHPAADLFPLMSKAELKVLANDIKKNGLQTPIVFWRADDNSSYQVIDGRNRLDAVVSLGWVKSPEKLLTSEPGDPHVRFVTGGDPYALALSYNVHRRHLTPEQKRELIANVLKATPEKSNNQIAKQVKTHDKAVAKVRGDLEATSAIPKLEKTVGADGKARKQPAKRKGKATASKSPAERDREFASLIGLAPESSAEISVEQRRAEFAALDDEERSDDTSEQSAEGSDVDRIVAEIRVLSEQDRLRLFAKLQEVFQHGLATLVPVLQ